MSIENLKTNPNVVVKADTEMKESHTVVPSQLNAEIVTPEASDIRRLAEDLMKTHGEKFANLFGASVFGADKAKVEDAKKNKAEELSKKIIQRIHITSEDEMRAFVRESLDDVYKNEKIINALTDYMCQHYEMLNEVELKRS